MSSFPAIRTTPIVSGYAMVGALSAADAIARLTAAYAAQSLTLTGWSFFALPTAERAALAMSGALPSEL